MRIVIMTTGSRGDVQPYLALGLGLKQEGYKVVVATHELFRAFVRRVDLEFRPVAGDPQAMLAGPRGQAWLRSGRSSWQFLRHFVKLTRSFFPELLRDLQKAAAGADLILFSPFAGPGRDIGEWKGIPSALAARQPFHATRAFPSMGAVGTLGLAPLNYLSHRIAGLLLWLPFRGMHNRWRAQELGLPVRSFGTPLAQMNRERVLALYGYSPNVIPKPADWGSWIEVTGYWFLELDRAWRPPAELTDFLASGPAPVYLGFGSMMRGRGEEIQRTVVEASERIGRRFLVQRGWQQMEPNEGSDRILVVDSLPHGWLFPRMAAVVHHGGAGTSGAGLRAGVPSVLVPHFADQFFWADRLHKLGVSPTPLPIEDFSGRNLAATVSTALERVTLRERAAAIGGAVRAEDGVRRAVQAIRSRFGPPSN